MSLQSSSCYSKGFCTDFHSHMVGMVLLPDGNAMARNIRRPVWGAAELGTLIIWPLATLVQFGVGQIFYRRAFAPMRPFFRYLLVARRSRHSLVAQHRRSRWRWTSLITFGNMGRSSSWSHLYTYIEITVILMSRSPGLPVDFCGILLIYRHADH